MAKAYEELELNRCSEDTALTLNDGTVKIILNTKGTLDDVTLQQEYRERFQEGKAEGIKEGRKEGKREGVKEGKIVGKIETLYEELHMTVVEIAEKLAISEEEVQRIVDALEKD